MKRTYQEGIALLSALLVLVLASVLAVGMISSQHIDIRRAQHIMTYQQALQWTLGAERQALQLLSEGLQQQGNLPWDDCVSPWIPVSVSAMQMHVQIQDLHCRFNINNLASGDGNVEAAFTAFLQSILMQEAEASISAFQLTQDIKGWLSPDTEQLDYRLMNPPYLSGNQLMAHSSELRLVRGVTTPVWRAMAPYITALPETTVPINHAKAPAVLTNAFDQTLLMPDDQRSRFFRLALHAGLGDGHVHLCTILDVQEQKVLYREQLACGL